MKKVFILGSILMLLVLSVFVYAAETVSSDAVSSVSGTVELVYQQHPNVIQETRTLAESENIVAVAAEKQVIIEDSNPRRKKVLEPVTAYLTKGKNKVTGNSVEDIVNQKVEPVLVDESDAEMLVKKIYDQRKKLKAILNLFDNKYKEQYNNLISKGANFEELEQNINDIVSADYNRVYSEDLLLYISLECDN